MEQRSRGKSIYVLGLLIGHVLAPVTFLGHDVVLEHITVHVPFRRDLVNSGWIVVGGIQSYFGGKFCKNHIKYIVLDILVYSAWLMTSRSGHHSICVAIVYLIPRSCCHKRVLVEYSLVRTETVCIPKCLRTFANRVGTWTRCHESSTVD